MMATDTLTLATLERLDPYAPRRDGDRRFRCPMPACQGKHNRNLSANTGTGAWVCHRCGARGKLGEFYGDRAFPEYQRDRRRRGREVLRRTFTLPPEPEPQDDTRLRPHLRTIQPLPGTAGAHYVEGRGINIDVAIAAGVRYSPAWYGRPAVVFPVRDVTGQLVAAQGRAITGDEKKAAGPKSRGVFATAGALQASPLVLVEAPIDALSLATEAIPAIAVCGTNLPDWLAWYCALRSVVVATDADEPGDAAAATWAEVLKARGASVDRWRPDGAKDWNALLCGR